MELVNLELRTDQCGSLDLEVEQDEMSRANPPVHLTRELWVCFFPVLHPYKLTRSFTNPIFTVCQTHARCHRQFLRHQG